MEVFTEDSQIFKHRFYRLAQIFLNFISESISVISVFYLFLEANLQAFSAIAIPAGATRFVFSNAKTRAQTKAPSGLLGKPFVFLESSFPIFVDILCFQIIL